MALSLTHAAREDQQARADGRATAAAVASWQDLFEDLENENAALREQNGVLRAAHQRHLREMEMLRAELATAQMRAAKP